MNVVIITSTVSYETRVESVTSFFEKQNHKVTIICTDFIHREKKKIQNIKKNYIFINTIPYHRNISITRLYSRYDFAKKAFKKVAELQKVDLLYVLLPANSLAVFAAKYKKSHNVKLVFDLIDLWPESLPFKDWKNTWPISVWRNMRDKNLISADLVFTECNLYQAVLKNTLKNIPTITLYWQNDMQVLPSSAIEVSDTLNLCYLGSINHIIDIPFIKNLLKKISEHRKIILHIIGDGEKKDDFLKEVNSVGVEVRFHGKIYKEERKREILCSCHYGLNIMKPDVSVGLTMKSVDYMWVGLPIINNIKGDTWELIEKEKIGYNCMDSNWEDTVFKIINDTDKTNYKREKIQAIYQQLFSATAFNEQLDKGLKL